MHSAVVPLFHFRPMVALAFGFCGGILLSDVLSGTQAVFAVCLFMCFFLAALRLNLAFCSVVALALALGLLRSAFIGSIVIPSSFLAPFESIRQRLLQTTAMLFGQEAPVLQAMLWGDKAGMSDTLYSAFRQSGIAHVLALSGLHVSFVAAAINRLTRKCHPVYRFAVCFGAMVLYCAIAAFPPSLVRATVMTLCLLYANVSGRRYDIASGLAFAALIILLWEPGCLFEVGFQLSFGAVAAIAMLMPALMAVLGFLPEDIASAISVSVCGTLGTLPLSVYYFHNIPLLGLFANILILPLVPFIFVPGIIACIIALFSPAAAMLLAKLPAFLTRVMISSAAAVSNVSFAVKSASITPLACVFIYLAYLCLSDFCLAEKKYKFAACAISFAAALLCVL